MQNIDAIIEKIKKLNAKASNEATTEAEAAMFSQKVAELLQEHNLEMSHIEETKKDEPIDKEGVVTPYSHIKWRQTLIGAVAQLYFCKGYVSFSSQKGNSKFMVAGKAHNRAVALSMFDYLCKAVVRLSRDFSSVPLERYHFEKGCGYRLTMRIMEEVYKVQKAPVSSANPGNLPMLYKTELALVDDFLTGAVPNMEQLQERKAKFNKASFAGYDAANGISLTNQVSSNGSNKFLLGGK